MSDTKVLRLAEAKTEPNELTIKRCEELLEAAKEGELRGFLIIGETNDGQLFEGGSEIYDLPLLMMGIEMAKVRLLDAVINGPE